MRVAWGARGNAAGLGGEAAKVIGQAGGDPGGPDLEHLEVHDLRIVEGAELSLGSTLNCLVGPNGSGKTTLLEAAYLVATGRSFRTREVRHLVRDGVTRAQVGARVRVCGGARHRVRCRLEGRATGMWLNGMRVRAASEVARLIPILVLRPESHRVVSGGAAERRALLDWGLFHVEQGFAGVYREYRRVLEQRNHLLRHAPGSRQLAVWTETLAAIGDRVHALRARHAPRYLDEVMASAGTLLELPVEVAYWPGWDVVQDLGRALAERIPQDLRLGATGLGPHRADLRLTACGKDARQVLSRGEAKQLAAALLLAQARFLDKAGMGPPIVLLDDLTSELDGAAAMRILGGLAELGAQAVAGVIDESRLAEATLSGARVFHVEQGRVRADGE